MKQASVEIVSHTSAENIVFMVVRGIVALAIVGLGFYCIAQGTHLMSLAFPHTENMGATVLKVQLGSAGFVANGLGAVIFGTGIALCFVGKEAAPQKIKWVDEVRKNDSNQLEDPIKKYPQILDAELSDISIRRGVEICNVPPGSSDKPSGPI